MIRLSNMFSKLSEADYSALPKHVSSVINYTLDSYFAKLSEYASTVGLTSVPKNPVVDCQEKFLACDVHKFFSLNASYPSFARSLTAHSFAMLFTPYGGDKARYRILPFLDSYEHKDLVKDEFKLEQTKLRISPDITVVLPVFGTFFIEDIYTKKRLVVSIDFCFYGNGCTVAVSSSPQDSKVADNFINALDASRALNDIYFKKCLAYNCGTLDFCEVSNTKWSDIIVKDELKNSILDNTVGVLDNVEKLKSLGVTPARNILMISPPGMAKTSVFRAISNDCKGKATIIWCTGKSIRYADHVTSLFQAARSLAPCIIMIEDMDLFGKDRSSYTESDSGQVLNEFLACLDGTVENDGVVVMASTNDVASMDEALINRPGRFDVKLEMPYPDEMDRLKMISSFCKQYNAKCDFEDPKDTLRKLVDLTDGLTGAYIKDLVKTAVIKSVSRSSSPMTGAVILSAADLLDAAEQVLNNFSIGQKAKSHHPKLEPVVNNLMGSNNQFDKTIRNS